MKSIRILLFIALTFPSLALAHSKVNSSNPENGSQAPAGIDTLELNFSKAVRVTRLGLHAAEEGMTLEDLMQHEQSAAQVLNLMAANQVALTNDMPNGFGTDLAVTFDGLETGIYHYAWIAVAQDGHLMEGQGHFEVVDLVTK